MKTPLREHESVLREGAATTWHGVEAIGGMLYLTSQRLVFESHWFNFHVGVTIIKLSEIAAARRWRTLFLIPNGVAIQLADGTTERFTVWRRVQWLSAITRARSEYAAA